MKEIEIAKILYLARTKKYEISCAAFDVVDHIFKIEIPPSLRGRKLAVQAMSLLANGAVKYGYEPSKTPQTVEDENEDNEEE